MILPFLDAWPGGLPCPWTRGTVDTVACRETTRGKRQSQRGRPDRIKNDHPWVGSGAGLVGGVLAAGGRACQHRPARSLHPGRGGRTRLPPRGPLAGPFQVARGGSCYAKLGATARWAMVGAGLAAPGSSAGGRRTRCPRGRAAPRSRSRAPAGGPTGWRQRFETPDLGLDVVGLEVEVHPLLGDLRVVGALEQDPDVGVGQPEPAVDVPAPLGSGSSVASRAADQNATARSRSSTSMTKWQRWLRWWVMGGAGVDEVLDDLVGHFLGARDCSPTGDD